MKRGATQRTGLLEGALTQKLVKRGGFRLLLSRKDEVARREEIYGGAGGGDDEDKQLVPFQAVLPYFIIKHSLTIAKLSPAKGSHLIEFINGFYIVSGKRNESQTKT